MDTDVEKLFKDFFKKTKPQEDPTKLLYAKGISDIERKFYTDPRTGKRYEDITEFIERESDDDATNYLRVRR